MTQKTPSDLDKLGEPFPPQAVKNYSLSGTSMPFIPISEVIARLNSSVPWSVVAADAWISEHDPDWVISVVTIEAKVDGETRRHIGYGGQKIKRTKAGAILDLGNEYKGAFSDALKKASQQLGVGLELARSSEMLEYEAEMKNFVPADPEDIEKIKAYVGTLSSDEKASFNRWWVANVGYAPDSGRVSADNVAAVMKEFSISG